MDYSAQHDAVSPLVTVNVHAMLDELSRLAGVNAITGTNQATAITALTDAQIAAFVRRILIAGITITP